MLTQSILPLLLAAFTAVLVAVYWLPPACLSTATTAPGQSIMSAKMRAVLHSERGSTADELRIGEVDRPQLKPDHILIRVKAFGLNRADIGQRQGKYPPPPGASPILGLECAGEVAEVGPASSNPSTSEPALPRFQPGERVMALLSGGAYAEYAIAHVGSVIRMPAGWSWEEGAACVEVFTTAYQLMRYIGKVQAGEVVLIHAGASGIGSAAIQLAHLFGAKAIVTAGSEDKLAYCKQLGADGAFNYKDANWASDVKALLATWNKDGVDVILDPVGRSHAAHNANLLALDARWLVFGLLSGGQLDAFDLNALMRKRAALVGTLLRSRSVAYKTALVGEMVREAYGALVDGRLRVTIDTVYGWDRVVEAHKHLEEDRTKGKVVCTVA